MTRRAHVSHWPPDQIESPIRLLICSKYRVLRAGLRLLVETDARINVVAEADSASAIYALAQVVRPDIILVDDDLCEAAPDTLGIDLQLTVPAARVLLLHETRERTVPRMFARNHELGVVSKGDAPEALLEAIRKVARGPLSESSQRGAALNRSLQPSVNLQTDDSTQWLLKAGTPFHRTLVFDKRVLAVLESVQNDLQKSEPIEVLARRVGIGGSRLRHLLRDLVGVSLSQFRRERRLHMAAHLLAHSHKRVSEIAYQVGFSDVAYFDKAFRKRFRLSPSRYRQLKLAFGLTSCEAPIVTSPLKPFRC